MKYANVHVVDASSARSLKMVGMGKESDQSWRGMVIADNGRILYRQQD